MEGLSKMKCPNCGQETEVITLGGREYCNKCGREIASSAGFEVHEAPKEISEELKEISELGNSEQLNSENNENETPTKPAFNEPDESNINESIPLEAESTQPISSYSQNELKPAEPNNQSLNSSIDSLPDDELEDLPIGGESKMGLEPHEVEQEIPVSIGAQTPQNFQSQNSIEMQSQNLEQDILPQTPSVGQEIEYEKPKLNFKKPLLFMAGLLLLGGIFFGAYTLYNGTSVKDLVGLGFPKDAKTGLEKALNVQASKTALTSELNGTVLGYQISSSNIREENEKYSADVEVKTLDQAEEKSEKVKVIYPGEDKIYTNLSNQSLTGGYWLETTDADLNKMFSTMTSNTDLSEIELTKFFGSKNKNLEIGNFSNITRQKDEKLEDISYYKVIADTDFNAVFGSVTGGAELFTSNGKTEFYIDKKEYFIKRIVFDATLNGLGETQSAKLEYVYTAYDGSFDIKAPENTLEVSAFISEFGEAIKSGNYESLLPKIRDARRKADLKQILVALKNYKEEKQQYPILTDDTKDGSFLETGSEFLGGKVPLDPLHPTNYYKYVGSDGNTFVLSAVLEDKTDPQGATEGDLHLYKVTQVDITTDN